MNSNSTVIVEIQYKDFHTLSNYLGIFYSIGRLWELAL